MVRAVALSLPPPRLLFPRLASVSLGHSVDLLHGDTAHQSVIFALVPGLGHNELVGMKIFFIQFREEVCISVIHI